MCKTVDSLYQKKHEEWFSNRLGNVKTLIVINFFNGNYKKLISMPWSYGTNKRVTLTSSPVHSTG